MKDSAGRTRRRHRQPGGCALSSRTEPDSRQQPGEPGQHRHGWKARLHALREKLHARRERIRAKPTLNSLYRLALGLIGGAVLVLGIALIPYPGPGWLVVFAGLGLLATEFAWAHRVNMFAKHHYHRWVAWLSRKHPTTKLAVMAGTCLIVLATLWVIGAFDLVAGWFGLKWQWLASPLFET